MNSTETVYYRYGSLFCSAAMLPVGAFGITGNLVAACVFRKQRRRWTSPTSSPSPLLSAAKSLSSINILLIALTVIDTLLLALATPLFSTIAFYNFSPERSGHLLKGIAYMTVYAYPVCMMAQCASVWTIVVISLERYAAVVHPFSNREHGNAKKTKAALVVVVTGAIAYNACRFGEYRLNDYFNSTTPALRGDWAYVDAYINWSYFALVFALPFAVLFLVNSIIARTIFRASRQRQAMLLTQKNLREHRTALMMAAVVLAYVSCNVLALVLNAWEAAGHELGSSASFFSRQLDTDLFRFLSDFNNLLIQTHSSLTFVVYFRFSGHFRQFVRERRRTLCAWGAAAVGVKLVTSPRKRTESSSSMRSRSTSILAAVRKYSSEAANRYRRTWSSVASTLSSSSAAAERRQNERIVQLVVREKMTLGLKRKAFTTFSRDSVESQSDPFNL